MTEIAQTRGCQRKEAMWTDRKEKVKMGVWNDSSLVKRTDGSSRGSRYNSQHSSAGSQSSLASVPGDLTTSSELHRHQACTQKYMQATPPYIKWNKSLNTRWVSPKWGMGKTGSVFVLFDCSGRNTRGCTKGGKTEKPRFVKQTCENLCIWILIATALLDHFGKGCAHQHLETK